MVTQGPLGAPSVKFHYTIVEVVSTAESGSAAPRAGSDASELLWAAPEAVAELEAQGQVSSGCTAVLRTAVQSHYVDCLVRV